MQDYARRESISDAVKGKSSISEVAERFAISRPTLYRYMDLYDNRELEKIPDGVTKYFDMITQEDTTRDDSTVYLINNDASKKVPARLSDAGSWSEGGLQTFCVTEDGVSTVFYRGGAEHPDETYAEVYLSGPSGLVLVGIYRPEEERRFVRIDDLPASVGFDYVVKQRCGESCMASPLRKLR